MGWVRTADSKRQALVDFHSQRNGLRVASPGQKARLRRHISILADLPRIPERAYRWRGARPDAGFAVKQTPVAIGAIVTRQGYLEFPPALRRLRTGLTLERRQRRRGFSLAGPW